MPGKLETKSQPARTHICTKGSSSDKRSSETGVQHQHMRDVGTRCSTTSPQTPSPIVAHACETCCKANNPQTVSCNFQHHPSSARTSWKRSCPKPWRQAGRGSTESLDSGALRGAIGMPEAEMASWLGFPDVLMYALSADTEAGHYCSITWNASSLARGRSASCTSSPSPILSILKNTCAMPQKGAA